MRPTVIAMLALASLVAAAQPSAAYLDRDSDCDGFARSVGAGVVADIVARAPGGDLDGDGAPDDVCHRFVWSSGADLGSRAHEACHVVQQRGAVDRACHGPGEGVAIGEEGAQRAATACFEATRAGAGTPAGRAAAACAAIADLDGDGMLDLAGAACGAVPDDAARKACMEQAEAHAARHEAAMNAIRNMKA